MSLSLNKPILDNLANEVWKSAERLRGKFKAYEYRKSLIHECVTGRRRVTTADVTRARREEVGASLPF